MLVRTFQKTRLLLFSSSSSFCNLSWHFGCAIFPFHQDVFMIDRSFDLKTEPLGQPKASPQARRVQAASCCSFPAAGLDRATSSNGPWWHPTLGLQQDQRLELWWCRAQPISQRSKSLKTSKGVSWPLCAQHLECSQPTQVLTWQYPKFD